jgi:hypothetical protein
MGTGVEHMEDYMEDCMEDYMEDEDDMYGPGDDELKAGEEILSDEDGDETGWHSQVCEAIIASRGYVFSVPGPFGTPVMNIYGTTHTSENELVTFAVQRNAVTDLIEVVATPTAESNGTVYLRIYSIETVTSD